MELGVDAVLDWPEAVLSYEECFEDENPLCDPPSFDPNQYY
jgi:hypothetical protein